MYERLTVTDLITVICIVGNAETMECTHYSLFHLGKYYPPKKSDLLGIKGVIKRWVEKAMIDGKPSARQWESIPDEDEPGIDDEE